MPWSINKAVDVLKWLIETHGGNDDLQAWRQICAYIAEAEKPSHNRSNVPCGDCGRLLLSNMGCDNPECVRVIMRHGTH